MTPAFDLEACSRLPLAEASLRLLDFIFAPDFLDDIFDRYRGGSYTKSISFPTLVNLVSDSLLGHCGSAHQRFRQAQDDGDLDATIQAAYAKLRRVPLRLSLGLFTESARRLSQLGTTPKEPLFRSLSEFRPLAFDGKIIKHLLKQLKVLQGLNGNIYGGKLLVVQNIATGQAVAVEANLDGEAGENPLVPGAVARARQTAGSTPNLWVADRLFCEFATLKLLTQGNDHFVIRYNARCRFYPDADRPTRSGTDDQGRPFTEEWGWLGTGKNRVAVRMISVERKNAEPLKIITSLLDADRYPAGELLQLYGKRWGIETMFQQVVQVFGLRRLISGSPEATVFQAVFCLLLYNITQIVRDYVAEAAQRDAQTVSSQLLFDELVRELTSWMLVIGPKKTPDVLGNVVFNGPEELKHHLCDILKGAWKDRWIKAPKRKRPPKKPPRAYLRGGHSSVDKIRRGAHTEIPIVRKNQKAAAKSADNVDQTVAEALSQHV